MKILRVLTFVFLTACAAAGALAQSQLWSVDPAHSQVTFSVRHMVVSDAKGKFTRFQGEVLGDPKTPATAKVSFTIDASSIDTDLSDRDDHLRSADFFDVEKYPQITFVSKRLSRSGNGWKMSGDLTMHGITRPVVLDVAPFQVTASDRISIAASTVVNRKDFGLKWNKLLESGGAVVGDDVTISIALQFVKKK